MTKTITKLDTLLEYFIYNESTISILLLLLNSYIKPKVYSLQINVGSFRKINIHSQNSITDVRLKILLFLV